MTWTMPKDIHEGRQYHLDGNNKRKENCRRGLAYAMHHDYDSWDGDLIKSLDKVILNTHWPDPIKHDHFLDPKHEFNSPYNVRKHVAADTERLVSPGGYIIRPVRNRFIEAHNSHRPEFVFSLEPKGPEWDITDMHILWNMAHEYQRPTIIKCAYTKPLQAAKLVGFQVRYTVDHRPGM